MRALGILLLAAGVASAAPPDVKEIVERLQERYDSTADFTAEFRQEVEVPTLGKTLESHGTVAFKRPGRMRWEFLEPERQTIVADGETMWIYQAEQHQVLKTPFQAAFQSATPVSFLFGVGDLGKDFDASLAGEEDDVYRVRLEPREDEDIGILVLTVSRDTYDLRGAEVTDPLGNVTRLELRNLVRDEGVPDARFVFDVPEGADVVEAPGRPPSPDSAGQSG